MNKLVINHLDKIFVTSDASVMMTELEVQHPAAKLLVMAAKAQETEIGDGTNLVHPSVLPTCFFQHQFVHYCSALVHKQPAHAQAHAGHNARRRAARQGGAPPTRGPHHY